MRKTPRNQRSPNGWDSTGRLHLDRQRSYHARKPLSAVEQQAPSEVQDQRKLVHDQSTTEQKASQAQNQHETRKALHSYQINDDLLSRHEQQSSSPQREYRSNP